MQKTFKPQLLSELRGKVLGVLTDKPMTTIQIANIVSPGTGTRSRNYVMRRVLQDLNREGIIKEVWLNPNRMSPRWGWVKR